MRYDALRVIEQGLQKDHFALLDNTSMLYKLTHRDVYTFTEWIISLLNF